MQTFRVKVEWRMETEFEVQASGSGAAHVFASEPHNWPGLAALRAKAVESSMQVSEITILDKPKKA